MSIKLKGSSDGSVSFDAPADTSPSGSDITLVLPTTVGSAEQFLKNSGTAGTLEFSSMVETSTGVGIGTSSPDSKLSIGTGNTNNRIDLADERAYVGYDTSYGSTGALYLDGGGSSNKDIILQPVSTGKVGIGTTSPVSKLDLGSDTGVKLTLLQNNYSLGVESNELRIASNQSTTFYTGGHSGTERVRIDGSGNVCIGKTSADALLDVNGQARFGGNKVTLDTDGSISGTISNSTTRAFVLSNTNVNADYFAGRVIQVGPDGTVNIGGSAGTSPSSYSSPNIKLNPAGSSYINGGSLGIGPVSPDRQLHVKNTTDTAQVKVETTASSGRAQVQYASPHGDWVQGIQGATTSGDFLTYTAGSKNIIWYTSGSERMRIDSSGRLLIGTSTSPSAGSGQYAKLVSTGNTSSSTGDGRLMLGRGLAATSMSSGQDIGSVLFTDNTGATFAAISSNVDTTPGSGDYPGRLSFATTNDGGATPTERMRIDNNGRVGIGTASAAQVLQVHKAASSPSYVHITNNVSGSTSSDGTLVGLSSSAEAIVWNQENTVMRFATNNAERMRITSSGFFKASNNGSYINASGSTHEFSHSEVTETLTVRNTNSSYSSTICGLFATRAATSAYWFIRGVSSSGGAGADNEFYIRGDGRAFADESWNGGGADYAEYFEWSDGNTEAEDRRGISVVLDGDKIREAVAGEEPIGVISGHPSVVGDADMDRWKGKYLRDDYGSYVLNEDGYRQLNPDFDSSAEYIQREDRPEWDTVGLMGKLRIRKGQVTGTRWIKMRDVSDTVEEWLVR